jgi:SpoVK/Ycf46/Vps4 family AAA+-type ATPase
LVLIALPGLTRAAARRQARMIADAVEGRLRQIDVARVLSKYIGETEKNLRRLLAEAAKTDQILFFDEADALFGRRTEVRDAHDRYANQEVAYLFTRLKDEMHLIALAPAGRVDPAFCSAVPWRLVAKT